MDYICRSIASKYVTEQTNDEAFVPTVFNTVIFLYSMLRLEEEWALGFYRDYYYYVLVKCDDLVRRLFSFLTILGCRTCNLSAATKPI
jgi:hypothetical protein